MDNLLSDNAALVVAVVSLFVAIGSYGTARRAHRRSGAAILKARIAGYPTVERAYMGKTSITITNTGPAIADNVTILIREDPADTKTRAPVRGKRGLFPSWHRTNVIDRLGIGDTATVDADGITDDSQRITIRWRDGAGRQRIHPEPPDSISVSFV